jgi:NADPH:quinone reductase-like Zn-dependent oxidoreductase
MLAEFVALDATGVVAVPPHLSAVEAATLPCAALTAWSALVTYGQIKPGWTVLTQGTGGVSLFALQLARLFGARVIITSKSDAKLERAKAMGASAAINYEKTPEWGKRVRELTDGLGADVVVELGGATTLAQSLMATRVGGQVCVIGVLGGSTHELSVLPMLMQNLRLQGVLVGSRERFEEMNRAIAAAELRPVVDRVFAFGEARAAFEALARGDHFGKICIQID